MRIRKLLSILISAGLIISLCAPISFGYSKTVTSKEYSIIKKGSIVYCMDYGCLPGIYRVNLKTKKAKKIVNAGIASIEGLSLHGDYLYYIKSEKLYRVKKSGGKPELLYTDEEWVFEYAITQNKIYVNAYDWETESTRCYESDLNDIEYYDSDVRVKSKFKTSNAKGYKITMKQIRKEKKLKNGKYRLAKYRIYLKTPKKKIVLVKSSYGGLE